MGREYVIQSWVRHDANDPRVIPDHLLDASTGYSGEQIGNRRAVSHGNTRVRAKVEGYLDNGMADLTHYPDQDEVFKDNPLFKIDPAFKLLALYQDQVIALDKALHDKSISRGRHAYALRVLDAKIHKAEAKLDKLAYNTIPDNVISQAVYQETREEYLLEDYDPTKGEATIANYIYENVITE